jgi:hypothetical protein
MNTGIEQLHEILLAQHSALAGKLAGESDPATARAIVREMRQILNRVDAAQKLLLSQPPVAQSPNIERVREADKKLTRAIDRVEEPAGIVKATTRFLKFADEVLDAARPVAVP